MAKLLSETVDARRPRAHRGRLGGRREPHPDGPQRGVPQVLPHYVAFSLYIFELNIRASTVIGIVGAGGIGTRSTPR